MSVAYTNWKTATFCVVASEIASWTHNVKQLLHFVMMVDIYSDSIGSFGMAAKVFFFPSLILFSTMIFYDTHKFELENTDMSTLNGSEPILYNSK